MAERIGVFVDAPYHVVDGPPRVVTSVSPFLHFACAVAATFDDAVLIGRTSHTLPPKPVVLEGAPRLVELPYYANLRQVGRVIAGLPRAIARVWRALDELDVVWVFTGGPMALVVAALVRLRRRRLVLGVRQQTTAYWRHRLRGRRERVALGPALALARLTDLVGRGCDRTVVGNAQAERLRAAGGRVLDMTILLVRDADIATIIRPLPAADAPVGLLVVGRIEQEKNPLLVVDLVERLQRDAPGRFHLTWVGAGRMLDEVIAHIAARGLAHAVTLVGYEAFGPGLLERYRTADVFVHVSHTEGVPQVVLEALACATPVVATAVGGVAAAVDEGAAALLVPPGDLAALVAAITATLDDAAGATARVRHGLTLARCHTFESAVARAGAFLRG